MNQKSWLWKAKSMEKTIFAADKVSNSSSTIEAEVHDIPTGKNSGVEISSKSLNEKLASVLLDPHAAEGFPPKHEQMSRGKIRGEDKATEEMESGEEEADEDLTKEISAESMCGAVPDLLKEHEKIQKELEEKLQENCKKLADLTVENTRLYC